MDLSKLYASNVTTVNILHPVTGEYLYCDDDKSDLATWSMLSRHTAEYKKLAAAMARDVKSEFGDKKLSDLSDAELEKLDSMTEQLTINATTAFNLFIEGEKPAFSKAKAAELLQKEELFWLRNQVTAGANETANFIKA